MEGFTVRTGPCSLMGSRPSHAALDAAVCRFSLNLLNRLARLKPGRHSWRALATGRKNKARLIIAKPDCLFRQRVFLAALIDSGIEFGAVDNPHYPHTNRLTLHSQASRSCCSSRTSMRS